MGKGQAAPKRTGHQEKTMANDWAHVKKTNKLFHQAGPTMESKRKKENVGRPRNSWKRNTTHEMEKLGYK